MVIDENDVRQRKRNAQFLNDSKVVKDYGTASNYASTIRDYINEFKKWEHATAGFQSSTNNFNNGTNSFQSGPSSGPQSQPINVNFSANSDYPIFQHFEPASYFRRFIAEGIDFCICLFLKLLFVLALVELDILDIEPYQTVIDDEHDIVEFIIMTQALLPLEFACKVICAFIEGAIMSIDIGPCRKGQTPGKWIVGIRVISANNVVDGGNRYMIQNPTELTFRQSMSRALLKNMIMNSFFPLSTVAFSMSTNRAFYDSITKTVVVIDA